jgi:hypothetical protein
MISSKRTSVEPVQGSKLVVVVVEEGVMMFVVYEGYVREMDELREEFSGVRDLNST